MLTYSFENIGDNSLYEYLYQCIKNDILNGRLKTNEHLPSKRTFALNLGVSSITVENAYGQLMSEGYIYSLPKKGYFVSDLSLVERITPISINNSNNVECEIMPAKEAVLAKTWKYDLSSNKTNPDSFPFSIWAKLIRKEISDNQDELMHISPSAGVWSLREAIAMHLASFRNMTVSPDQIIIGAGTEYLYGLLIQLLGREKIYCVENPGYSKIAKIYESNEVTYRYANLDKDGIIPSEIAACNANIVHISPTHHFPTGITMPVSRRFELLAWANESNDRYIIEDDYDSEFRMTGKTIPTLKSIDVSERIIYINTFSRTLTPTIRISYMVLPPSLAKKFKEKLGFYACTVSNFEQYTLASFIKNGYFEKHLNRMRLFYSKRRNEMLSVMKTDIGKSVGTVIEADSGLHFILKLNTDFSDSYIKAKMADNDINITALSEYYIEPDKSKDHTFVISYSDMDPEEFKEALTVLNKIIDIKKMF